MKNSRIIYTCALMLSVIASLGLASLRVLALMIEFEPSAGYYVNGAALPTAFYAGAAIVAVILLLFTVLLRGELSTISVDSADVESPAITFISAFCGFIIAGAALFSAVGGAFGGGMLSAAAVIFSFPAAIYFLLCVALPIRSKNAGITLSALLILWLFFTMVETYFSAGVEINNPNKTLLLVTLAVTTVFFLAECRFRLGTEKRPFYIFTGLVSLVLLGLYSLPNIVLLLLHAYPDVTAPTRDVVMFALFFYVLIRMCVISGMIGGENDDDEDEEEDEDEEDDNEDNEEGGVRRVRRIHRVSEYDADDSYSGDDANDR